MATAMFAGNITGYSVSYCRRRLGLLLTGLALALPVAASQPEAESEQSISALSNEVADMRQQLEQLNMQQQELQDQLSQGDQPVSFSGFLSMRGGAADEEGVFAGYYSDKWQFQQDSVVGLQMHFEMDQKLSAELQLIARGSDDFDVSMDLGFLEYRPSQNMSVRAGRLRIPAYMLSEYLDVGYAYPWVKSPAETYRIFPLRTYEGIDFRYWHSFGAVDIQINPYIGASADGSLIGDLEGVFYGADLKASMGAFAFRLSFNQARLDYDESRITGPLGQLITGDQGLLNTVSAAALAAQAAAEAAADGGDPATSLRYFQEAQALQQQVDGYPEVLSGSSNFVGTFLGFGASYDDGDWLLMAELTQATTDSYLTDADSRYLMLGYRFGPVLPYVTWAQLEQKDEDERPPYPEITFSEPGLAADTTPVEIAPGQTAGQLYAAAMMGSQQQVSAMNSILDYLGPHQKSWTFGLRYDVFDRVAIKAEYQHVYGFQGTNGLYEAEDVFAEPPESLNVYRVSVDMVF